MASRRMSFETGLRCATTLRIAAMFGAISDRPLTVGFLLVPNFSMMAFASAVEPLRSANRQSGEELYRWRLFSADGSPVVASNGIPASMTCGISGNVVASRCGSCSVPGSLAGPW